MAPCEDRNLLGPTRESSPGPTTSSGASRPHALDLLNGLPSVPDLRVHLGKPAERAQAGHEAVLAASVDNEGG